MSWVDTQIAEKEVKTTKEIEAYVDEAIEFYKYYAESYGMELADFAVSYLGLPGISSEKELRTYILNDRKLTIAIQNKVAETIKKKEIEDYYNENYKTTYTYRYILLADDDDTEKNVKKIFEELDGKKDDKLIEKFTSLAKKYSTDSATSDKGGLVENATKNTVNSDVWSAISKLKDNKYSKEAIETDDGIYIVLRVAKGKTQKLSEVEEEIRTNIAIEMLEEDTTLRYDVLKELRNKYKLAFYDSGLKKDYENYLQEVEDYKKQLEEASKKEEE